MPQPDPAAVLAALATIQDPDLRRDIVSLGFVKDLAIDGGAVSFTIELTTPACPVRDRFKDEARAAVSAVPGVVSVDIEMTARVRGDASAGPLIPGVANVIAVASGKGGVGKSTVSCNLAIALAETGARVGLLDADVYGPSVPMMMGVEREQPIVTDERIVPVERFGVKIMSLGFFLDDDRAVIWRGPMIGKALTQFLGEVEWGELDYLVVDLPPGTGDASMSLAQLIPLTGVVVVMTPQDVAQQIANKAVLMFRAMEEATGRAIPIIGVVENMSGFVCPHCGEETPIFSLGGGEKAAARLGVPFLGSLPLDGSIVVSGDQGRPAVVREPYSTYTEAFRRVAGQVAARVSTVRLTGGRVDEGDA